MDPFVGRRGRWTSAASMVTWLIISTFILISQVQSESVEIVRWSPHIPAVIGQKVTLTCVFNTPVRCEWYKAGDIELRSQLGYWYDGDYKKNDKATTSDCSLMIVALEEQDFTMWYCTGFPDGSRPVHSSSIYITKQATPSAPVIWFDGAIVSSIEWPSPVPLSQIVCVSHRGNPPPSLHWEVNGTVYSGMLETTPSVTNLYSVYLYWDRGIEWKTFPNVSDIICKVNHPGFTNTKEAKVKIRSQYAPRTVKIVTDGFNNDNITIGRGASVMLSCNSDGHPQPNIYTWELWSEKDTRWNFYTRYEQNVTVTSEQLGRYRCKASNGLNRYSPTTSINQLIVTESMPPSAPVIMFNNEIVSVIELPSPDPPSHMVCRSPKGNPPPQLQWEVNGTPYLGRTETIYVGGYLYMNELHWDRGGGWHTFDNANEVVCTAKYTGLTNAPEARVEFNRDYAPKTVRVTAEGTVTVPRDHVLLSCISDGHPQPTFYTWESWSEDDRQWKLHSINKQNISVTTEQLGRYRCKASNYLNHHSPTTSINQLTVSPQVEGTIGLGFTAIVAIVLGVTLIITVIVLTTFVIQLRRKLSKLSGNEVSMAQPNASVSTASRIENPYMTDPAPRFVATAPTMSVDNVSYEDGRSHVGQCRVRQANVVSTGYLEALPVYEDHHCHRPPPTGQTSRR